MAEFENSKMEQIMGYVCAEAGISREDIKGPRRFRDVAYPRQEFCYLARKLTKKSLPQIGRVIGGRDHTTVMAAVRRVKERMDRDPEYQRKIERYRLEVARVIYPQFVRSGVLDFKSVRPVNFETEPDVFSAGPKISE